jgi:hypothetical protein
VAQLTKKGRLDIISSRFPCCDIYAYANAKPVDLSDPSGLDVYICERAADLPFPLSLANHTWIKTDSYEAGMGGMGGGVPAQGGNSDWPYDSTQTNDHSGQSKTPGAACHKQQNVNEQCVNRRIKPGQSTGRWTPYNQCQSFAYSVVNSCRYGPQLAPVVPSPSPDGSGRGSDSP